MYLARKRIRGINHYFIRESYRDGERMRHRELMALGPDPTQFLEYPGGNAFYVDEAVEETLREKGTRPVGDELEDLFWPFVDPEVRHAQEHFRHRTRRRSRPAREKLRGEDFHLFDRRRVHFLRYGQMDQGNIGRVSPRLYRALADKSRDEIEQYFMREERVLRPHELKTYLFVAFDLQRHFGQAFAKTMPQALDQSEVDETFLGEVCRLHADAEFWGGMGLREVLHRYLIRYVALFFDHEYGRSGYLQDILNDWINQHRAWNPPRSRSKVGVSEASAVFDVPESELRSMSRAELTRMYRKKAMKHHPDQGGDPAAFIRLAEAYQALVERKI
ncbi:MAG: J domain-containing protein [Desulfococcaceae bacterium]